MTEFDAIVVGSGMSGGWVAKELCERGLKVLVIERGKDIDPSTDYSDMEFLWERENLDRVPQDEVTTHYPIQMSGAGYAIYNSTKHLWVKDDEHPFETPPDKPYHWIRGYHLGGRSLMWFRASYRLSPDDFENNKRDGHGIDWPIRYEDLAPWYDRVESFAGISGSIENLEQLPDGVFQPAFELTCVEKEFKASVEKRFPGRTVISGRTANLTDPTNEQQALGRGQCQSRFLCYRGCSFGAYFSSISATLPAAKRTGNLTVITDAICDSFELDNATQRVTGVNVIDATTKQRKEYKSRLVFLNASAIASSMILLNSKSASFPNGLANRSDQVGRNLMDHVGGAYAVAEVPGHEEKYYWGRRPIGFYIPRYSNFTEKEKPYLRGFGFQGRSYRVGWSGDKEGVGKALKLANRTPGPWRISASAFGEVLPDPNNRVTLHRTRTDKWGMPIAYIDCQNGPNEKAMMEAASADIHAMFEGAGFKIVDSSYMKGVELWKPGHGIHEMGTARMGEDPVSSVLNKWNQAHDVKNLFITDGSAMTSSATQNPSLTYMALSARAANYAADQLAQGYFDD